MNYRKDVRTWMAGALFLLAMGYSACADLVIYVDDDAVVNNDGTNWVDAYTYLQDALAEAEAAEKPVEIRVAQGVYKPDQGRNQILGDRRASFHLINGVSLIGGYAGLAETDPNARNVERYLTVLSGDLNGDDIDVNDPCDLRNEPTRTDNSERIVDASGVDVTTILDGFTVSAGFGPFGAGMGNHNGNPILINCTFKGNTAYHDYGGGVLNSSGSPKLVNCMFTGNYAKIGGGMCSISSSPTLTGCAFTCNYAQFGAGLGNMKDIPKGNSSRDSNSTLIDCTFIDNIAGFRGGGMYNVGSDSNLSNCTFSGNQTRGSNYLLGKGAGLYHLNGKLTTTDCDFHENTASAGGGIYSEDSSQLILTSCTFRDNVADVTFGGGICSEDTNEIIIENCILSGNTAVRDGGGIFNRRTNSTLRNCLITGNITSGSIKYNGAGGGLYAFGDTVLINCTFSGNWAREGRAIRKYIFSNLRLTNCILWDGEDAIFDPDPFALRSAITYSNIQGGWEGDGNVDSDPLFAYPGYWTDANDPNIVVEPNHPDAIWVDGDYRLKSQAGRWDPNSQSWVQDDVTSSCIDAGDPNSPIGHEPFPNGGVINMGAYGGTDEASKSYFGGPVCETIIAGDINGDCKVDFEDLMILVAHWHQDNAP